MTSTVTDKNQRLRALCVARHPYLSDHFARVFAGFGVETRDAVGLGDALVISRHFEPHVVICEYEVLVTLPLEVWERDELLSKTPIIAVSLTRRSHESHLLDVNGIGGFLYLPALDRDSAMRIITASASRPHYSPAPVTTSLNAERQVTI